MATETATTATADTAASAETTATQDSVPASAGNSTLDRDAIRETHRKALAAGAKPEDDDEDSPVPAQPAPAEQDEDLAEADGDDEPKADEKADRPVAAIARLSTENRELKTRIKELEASAKPNADDSIAALRARVKTDPGVLMEVFGEDIEADAEKRLARFNDSVLERSDRDPKLSEQEQRVSRLEQELRDEKAARVSREQEAGTARAKANTARALTESFKGEDGTVIVDAAKFPFVNHLTKVGEVDAHALVTQATSKLVIEFAEEKGRDPTRDEVAQLIAISAGKIEEFFSKRAKNFVLPTTEAPKTEPDRARDRRPNTVTQSMAGRATDPPKTLSVEEQRDRIREEHRRALRAQGASA